MMKKVLAWLLVLSLTAAISIGATLAYLTDTDEDVNVMTLGKVKIDQLEYERIDDESANEKAEVQEFRDNKPLYPAITGNGFDYTPGDTYVDWTQIGKDGYTTEIWNPEKINNEQDKMVFIKNKGDYDAFVRTVFAFEAGNYKTLDEFKKMVHLNLNETNFDWEWIATPVTIGESTYFVATATYNKVLAPGALTEISLSQIALDKTATNEDVKAFGDTYQILVKSQAIQADGFNNAIMALNDGFDVIDASNIPWETDAPVVGADVRTALKYLNADPTGTDITAKVTKVVFGRNSDHPEIVNGYEGVLAAAEQDVPVYAYYVPNGSNYDVYLLANSDIYLPKDSGRLFQDMSSLVTVDTSNLNTSRVVLMNHLFFRCSSLTDVDVSGFDTSNVTTMKSLFNNCKKLKFVDVANWDTSNVTDTSYFLNNCVVMETLDVSGWDTSKVTITEAMFQYCRLLEKITGIENFKTGNVETMGWMFYDCKSLKSLDLSGWDTSKVTAMNSMFSSNISNAGDMALSYLNISTWDTGNVTKMNHMFNGCAQLKELDLSKWDMSKVRTTSHMFADCFNIQSIDFTGWNTASLTSMDAMFNDCRTIKEIDVSHFDTGNCLEFSQMFESCHALEKIIGMDQWDTSSAYVFDEMFNGASKLKEVDFSSFDTSAVTYGYILQNGEKDYHGYGKMFNGTTGLQKLIMSDKFVFAGDGSLQPGNYPKFPNPAPKEGYTAMWRNVETGELFLGKDIPEKTAATYEAHYIANT